MATGQGSVTQDTDLVQAQREWIRTYAALARQPLRTAVLRRHLQLLSSRS
jgi:hypothetical protein